MLFFPSIVKVMEKKVSRMMNDKNRDELLVREQTTAAVQINICAKKTKKQQQ